MTDTAQLIGAHSFARFRSQPQILQDPPEFLDQLPIAIYACDAAGRLCWFNRRALSMWGRAPAIGEDSELFCGSHRLYDIDGRHVPHAECPMAKVLATGVPVQGIDVVIERPDGSRVTAMVHIDPVRDGSGRLVGAINCFHDITRMKAAERQARDSERRLRDLLDALPIAVYTTDPEGYVTSFNEAAAALWQQRPTIGESQWCGSWRLRFPGGEPMPHDQCPMALTLKGLGDFGGREAMLERKDGTRIPFLAFPSLLRDNAGRVTGAVNMLVDISERKRAEECQKTLIDELNHRVKNTLATVLSLAANTAREAAMPPTMLERFQSRLIALSRTHDHLTSGGWRSADLQALVREILAPYRHGREERIEISGPPVALAPRQALAVAMVLNELATNAVRHGSLCEEGGRLELSWKVDRPTTSPRLHIHWTERGKRCVLPPDRRGFGMRLIERSIESELSGKIRLSYGKSGLRGVFSFPLA